MNSLISNFINSKKKEEENRSSDLIMEIENHSINKNVNLAKAAQSLNGLQILRISEHLSDFTEKLENPIKEIGFKFKDSSILLSQSGRLVGLSIDESSLWIKGIYFKSKIEMPVISEENNTVIKKEESRPLKLSM